MHGSMGAGGTRCGWPMRKDCWVRRLRRMALRESRARVSGRVLPKWRRAPDSPRRPDLEHPRSQASLQRANAAPRVRACSPDSAPTSSTRAPQRPTLTTWELSGELFEVFPTSSRKRD
jgi:hypothetical protein